ncbi:hypothetical protein [Natrarchaeobaculum sulfurireducens]|uniref:Uncharacterized protein n=1 Tax=Natrarchaeobaculum sulfurireducens TaxID=2044521 RepID=A0A346PKY7_9EURY|nr:hypothetical protein [Natrarchaeobaculum sulfurireducens]AXR76505.1 hypothetical protein AArc1_0155 [Natrarchaeobaculum sulfurireducens]AXR80182.1 hypothetical protein AArcMg_0153 [Natrarchaeobaculum sulfurireducens]
MSKTLVYFASLAVIGAVFVVLGTASLVAGAVGPGSVLMALGGLSLIGYGGYTLIFASEPSEPVPQDGIVWTLAVAAVLFVLWAVVFPPV